MSKLKHKWYRYQILYICNAWCILCYGVMQIMVRNSLTCSFLCLIVLLVKTTKYLNLIAPKPFIYSQKKQALQFIRLNWNLPSVLNVYGLSVWLFIYVIVYIFIIYLFVYLYTHLYISTGTIIIWMFPILYITINCCWLCHSKRRSFQAGICP